LTIARAQVPTPPHHTEKGFRNVPDAPHAGFGAVLKWRFGLGSNEQPPVDPDSVPPYVPAIVAPDLERIRHPDTAKVQVTWIGHSSFLIQAGGLNILTDPVWSERISPVSFIGPSRHAPPGLRFEDLPPIDLVLVSHNHYDHLDKATVIRLGNRPRYIVPLGLQRWFADLDISNVEEHDWWDSASFAGIRLWCVPAQHFSGRGPGGFDGTLWCGWMVNINGRLVYFAGDTGYSPHFREIRERLGNVDLALLPIGAYRPRWFMRPMHLDPPEALRASKDLRARRSIGMHWGTFRQSSEPLGEPPAYLRQCLRRGGVGGDAFAVLALGQTAEY
jgi:N-acyl-phosphatidylethanolamine-hydrolysing phospholipase D